MFKSKTLMDFIENVFKDSQKIISVYLTIVFCSNNVLKYLCMFNYVPIIMYWIAVSPNIYQLTNTLDNSRVFVSIQGGA